MLTGRPYKWTSEIVTRLTHLSFAMGLKSRQRFRIAKLQCRRFWAVDHNWFARWKIFQSRNSFSAPQPKGLQPLFDLVHMNYLRDIKHAYGSYVIPKTVSNTGVPTILGSSEDISTFWDDRVLGALRKVPTLQVKVIIKWLLLVSFDWRWVK